MIKENQVQVKQIVTVNICPPIPIRDCDWIAYYNGEEEGNIGYGKTKQMAIDDLLNLEER